MLNSHTALIRDRLCLGRSEMITTSASKNLSPFQSTHARWRAITHRDPAAHCSFIYGVKTTGIYCRPTCTARLARRANIVYYETGEQAEKDGYRPCTRCKPDDAVFIGQREEVVLRALQLLRVKPDSARLERGLKELAKDVGVTPSYLCRAFKKTMGCTLGQYCRTFETVETDTASSSSLAQSRIGTSEYTTPTVSSAGTFEHISPAHEVPQIPRGLDEVPIEQAMQSQLGPEELFDADFDFSEWFWSEGFDFESWSTPNEEPWPDYLNT